ncbi:2-(1,2-epoxy-1,2-dihydrophenyl)acetyl-CoA isomerase PaaG [Acinetobacter bereziniae]|uniref:2-(1,2-epoxy-1,2-dihydrophenyl)acetyl-CoA isomerase PaaG n=1 Tax=Acinetobacter bereziniae TaxID=106648 RepID=UPI0021D2F863|nr:2-(1,2-epoxy-1,2-dihydrophenyl)acetyl-CoA isomerase PaaG [Acinetobacter bereziniae]MCU4317388.1 2-(1,2-epoxy-1,2-dihydrophenyl)acetyl-CoA isomerase PaaG [Acinetobacter bereziniae]
MNFQHILVRQHNKVGYLTLNRPEVLNSFNEQMHQEIILMLDQWSFSQDIHTIVISGAGKGFCAGQDLTTRSKEVISAPDYDAGAALEKFYNPLILKITQMSKPVIAAVNGVAAGAGANLALSCDMVVAKQSARFIQSFCKVGLVPDAGGTWHLPHLVGLARAKGLAMLGDQLSAQQALNWGLIWEVYEDEAFEQNVIELAERLANQPSSSISLIKQAFNHAPQNTLADQLQLERQFQRIAGHSVNYKEGVAAFMEKRKPQFN